MKNVFLNSSSGAAFETSQMSRERYEHVAQSLYTLASQLSDMAYQNVQQARFITERKRIEAELAQARDEAEAAAKVKSEFLANMSHEIRTPMTAILGFSDMLMDDKMEPRQMEAVTTIRRNGEYLLQIINDILDLSKIEAGRLEVEHIPCSPSQILSEVISLMRVRAQEKGLPLEIEFDGTMPQSIQSDPIRLRQILINLIGNAIKFTETGSVCVEARIARCRIRRSEVAGRRDRHRHWDVGRADGQALQAVHPGRFVVHPPLRRNGAGAGHQQASGGESRRRHHRQERAG